MAEELSKEDFKRMSAPDRRLWLLEAVKTQTWYVMNTNGRKKQLAELFGVDRSQITRDFIFLREEMEKGSDLGAVKFDAKQIVTNILTRAQNKSTDPKLTERERAMWAKIALDASQQLISTFESFGDKERDMSPPPMKEEKPDEARLTLIAREYASQWKGEHRPVKPEDVR